MRRKFAAHNRQSADRAKATYLPLLQGHFILRIDPRGRVDRMASTGDSRRSAMCNAWREEPMRTYQRAGSADSASMKWSWPLLVSHLTPFDLFNKIRGLR